MTSAELRRIVGAMTERPFCMCGVGRFASAPCDKCIAKSALANHATALVALLEACETTRDWNDIDAAVAAVHAAK